MTDHNHITRDIKAPGKCPACDEYHGRHNKAAVTDLTPDALSKALDRPFTFDLLRDPDWQPTREHYRALRDGAQAAPDAERARNENTEKFLSKTQDRVELLESLNLRALARITDLEAVAEAARNLHAAVYKGDVPLTDAGRELLAALAVLEEPQ